MKQAMFFKRLQYKRVQCHLCPHFCLIKQGERGKCGVRENRDGTLYSLVYEKALAAGVDPIEKKPLFHFLPGSLTFSVATAGCNLVCDFCQNWRIAQSPKSVAPIAGRTMHPKDIVRQALDAGCRSIAYTYTEPTIFFEYAYETARLARKSGLKNVFVSNGFITAEAVDTISPYLDAINIDLKGFSEGYYRDVCGGRLQPVLDAVRRYHSRNVWVELTTLIVPGYTTHEETLSRAAEFIASVDPAIPWHISRFFPGYRMKDTPPTEIAVLEKAIRIGKAKGLKYTYTGNMPGDPFESTYCPNCREKVIERAGLSIRAVHLDGDRCAFCHEMIDLVI